MISLLTANCGLLRSFGDRRENFYIVLEEIIKKFTWHFFESAGVSEENENFSNTVTLVRRRQSGGVGRVLESAVSALNILYVTRRVSTKRKQQKRFFPLKTIFLLFFFFMIFG